MEGEETVQEQAGRIQGTNWDVAPECTLKMSASGLLSVWLAQVVQASGMKMGSIG